MCILTNDQTYGIQTKLIAIYAKYLTFKNLL